MSATVHRLFRGLGNTPQASASSSGAVGPMAPNPLVDALRAATTPILLKQLRALFEGADDALFGMSQRAAAAEEHRSSFPSDRSECEPRCLVAVSLCRLEDPPGRRS